MNFLHKLPSLGYSAIATENGVKEQAEYVRICSKGLVQKVLQMIVLCSLS